MPHDPKTLLCGRIDTAACQDSCWRHREFKEECRKAEVLHHPSCPRRHTRRGACIGCAVSA